MTESYPLKWPLGRSTTPHYSRRDARFDTTIARSRDELLHELKLLGARNVVISSNIATYRRGGQDIMYSDQTAARDNPGVAVYYEWKGESYALACDRWKTVADNLQALNKTVNAIRGIDRWGTGEMMKAAFAGFKELPAQQERNCWEVLKINPTRERDVITYHYKQLAKQYHPDAGGSHQMMTELNLAYEQALQFANQ